VAKFGIESILTDERLLLQETEGEAQRWLAMLVAGEHYVQVAERARSEEESHAEAAIDTPAATMSDDMRIDAEQAHRAKTLEASVLTNEALVAASEQEHAMAEWLMEAEKRNPIVKAVGIALSPQVRTELERMQYGNVPPEVS
jgi:hypothetical protein